MPKCTHIISRKLETYLGGYNHLRYCEDQKLPCRLDACMMEYTHETTLFDFHSQYPAETRAHIKQSLNKSWRKRMRAKFLFYYDLELGNDSVYRKESSSDVTFFILHIATQLNCRSCCRTSFIANLAGQNAASRVSHQRKHFLVTNYVKRIWPGKERFELHV